MPINALRGVYMRQHTFKGLCQEIFYSYFFIQVSVRPLKLLCKGSKTIQIFHLYFKCKWSPHSHSEFSLCAVKLYGAALFFYSRCGLSWFEQCSGNQFLSFSFQPAFTILIKQILSKKYCGCCSENIYNVHRAD